MDILGCPKTSWVILGQVGLGTQSGLEKDVQGRPGLFWDWVDLRHREDERGMSLRRPWLFWDWLNLGHRVDERRRDVPRHPRLFWD